MSGDLLVLWGLMGTFDNGASGRYVCLHSNYVKSKAQYELLYSTNSLELECKIPRFSDSIQLEYLVIKCSTEIDPNEIISKLDNFELLINEQSIWNNKIDLFTKLNKIKIINNEICIKLPFDMFVSEIILLNLFFSDVICKLNLHQTIENCEFSIYVDKRKYIRSTMKEDKPHYIQQIFSMKINYNEPFIVLNQPLSFSDDGSGISKGYLLDGNINKIKKFKLQFTITNHNYTYTYIDYDETMIQLYGVNINDKLLFIPFNTDKNYYDININSYESSINHRSLNFNCEITFSEPQTYFYIHSIQHNLFQYSKGYGGLAFS